jgi:hypothetical protein
MKCDNETAMIYLPLFMKTGLHSEVDGGDTQKIMVI